jgi:putative ABC transport system substrate-binding protein
MKVISSKRVSGSCFDNLKSKIGNPKLVGLALVIAFVGLAGLVGAQPKKVPRIGYLSAVDPARESGRSEAIRLALRELGYIEGQNIAIEYRYTEGKLNRAVDLAAELVRLKVDMIVVAGGGPWIRATKKTTKLIPIIMVGVGADPVEGGLVESLARPGGNITGLTFLNRDLGGKRLELLKEAVPRITSVAVLYDPALRNHILQIKEVESAARSLGLTVRSWDIRAGQGFQRVVAALSKERPDGLYVPGGPLMAAYRKQIDGNARKNRLPSVFQNKEDVEAGGLMSYAADEAESYERVAYYVDRILKGAKPADLPVEQPTKFEFVVNLKTANQIGLAITPNVLARADRVIK